LNVSHLTQELSPWKSLLFFSSHYHVLFLKRELFSLAPSKLINLFPVQTFLLTLSVKKKRALMRLVSPYHPLNPIPSSSIEPSSITFNYKLLKPYLLYPEDELLHRRKFLFVKRFSSHTIQLALYPEILVYFKSLCASPMISPIVKAVSESFEAAPVIQVVNRPYTERVVYFSGNN
jgi:hypothetical protein